jgi:hypothetical protein
MRRGPWSLPQSIEGDQIGLLLVDPGLVGAFELVCFLRCESQIAEALVRTVSASRERRVIGIDSAQDVAVAAEVELDGSQGVLGAQNVDLALTEALEPFQSVVAFWTVSLFTF